MLAIRALSIAFCLLLLVAAEVVQGVDFVMEYAGSGGSLNGMPWHTCEVQCRPRPSSDVNMTCTATHNGTLLTEWFNPYPLIMSPEYYSSRTEYVYDIPVIVPANVSTSEVMLTCEGSGGWSGTCSLMLGSTENVTCSSGAATHSLLAALFISVLAVILF